MFINRDFYDLRIKFYHIKRMGWVTSLRNGPTGVGYTFECLLNKKEDNLQLPDFKSIEIKTLKYFSKRKIHLFNATPESIFFSPIKRILNKYGYPDSNYPEYKVFNISVNAIEEKRVGYNYLTLKVDRNKRKIFLHARTSKNIKNNLNIFWSFEYLDNILKTKLSNLAIVWSCYKKVDNKDMFFYTKMDLYKYTNIDNFIDLIEKGLISITFKISFYKSEERFGQLYDKGTDFSIYEKDIGYLFEKLN